MTSYIEYKIEDSVLKTLQKDAIDWSLTDRSLLALSVYSSDSGGTLVLLNEDGMQPIETYQNDSEMIPMRPGVKIRSFQWNPCFLALSISWESGDLGVYSIKNMRTKWTDCSVKAFNKQKSVMTMEWMSDGLSLFTVDIANKIIIWTYDEMANLLIEKFSYQVNDQISDTVTVKMNKISFVYFGSISGNVYQMNESTGTVTDIVAVESGVKRLLHYSKRNRLIIITESMLLCQYSLSTSNPVVCEVSKVKLSSSARNITSDIVTAMMIDDAVGLIAICFTNERVVRLWQLESGNSAAVIIAESAESHWAGVTSISYWNGLMAAGTSNSHVIIWKRSSGLEFNRVSQIQVKGSVKQICIGRSGHIASITTTNDIYLINEQNMCFSYRKQMVVIQNGAKQIRVRNIDTDMSRELRVEIPVRSIYVGTDADIFALRLSGSKRIDFYRLNPSTDVIDSYCSANIKETDNMIAIHNQFVWTAFVDSVQNKATFSLVCYDLETNNEVINQIDLLVNADNSVMQIKVIAFEINGNSLLTVLSLNSKLFLYIFKLNGQKQTIKSGPIGISHHKNLVMAKLNLDSSMAAFVDNKLLSVFYDNQFIKYNLENENKEEIEALLWADNEQRLLCYSTNSRVKILLCSGKEMLIKFYDQIDIDKNLRFIALKVPIIYFLRSDEIVRRELSELEGLSEETTSILLDFFTTKSMDLNHVIKRVNQIGDNNNKLWTNLAKISVKSRDIDMGLYCASKLQNARIVRDVKQELKDSGTDVASALLAMNLGLHTEAETILQESGNRLKLSEYYQNRNEWQKAIECVDRLNQKTVYYNYAKHLEQNESNITEAIKYYEMSSTHVFEVPRMLFDIDGTGSERLRDYCLSEKSSFTDKEKSYLTKWWGQYCESQADIGNALIAYQKAKDYYNSVRLLCYTGESEKAKALINTLTTEGIDEANPTREAAMLHLGRHLEAINPIESINYYLPSGAIKHAIRVCKANNFINELVKLIITYGNEDEAKDVVENYVENNEYKNEISDEYRVQIYYKCGHIAKAIESALRARTWPQLRDLLADQISKAKSEQKTDIKLNEMIIESALDALKTDSDIIDIVIDLLLLSDNDMTSLMEQLIRDHNIEVNDKLVDKVEKVTKNKDQRRELMLSLADMALQKGNCLVAAKLYNNQGMRTDAIKALIRTGETEKVISYANIARDKNVYKIAANYLQTMDYSDDNVITTFFRKAGIKSEVNRSNKREVQ